MQDKQQFDFPRRGRKRPGARVASINILRNLVDLARELPLGCNLFQCIDGPDAVDQNLLHGQRAKQIEYLLPPGAKLALRRTVLQRPQWVENEVVIHHRRPERELMFIRWFGGRQHSPLDVAHVPRVSLELQGMVEVCHTQRIGLRIPGPENFLFPRRLRPFVDAFPEDKGANRRACILAADPRPPPQRWARLEVRVKGEVEIGHGLCRSPLFKQRYAGGLSTFHDGGIRPITPRQSPTDQLHRIPHVDVVSQGAESLTRPAVARRESVR